ncbi:hypothetical protein [Kitasatospora azatica]|uniref:hypothetical protein n=1 Tax=Kitasatospora azatica TaxID=58347 RepID=UPI0005684B03|nr:hypothetical protein [Kitasatospora azatica]
MTAHQPTPATLPGLRALAATVLATAIAAALTADDRFADAHRQIHRIAPGPALPPGHTDLVRRESAYRLAHAAQLNPHGLLAPSPAPALEGRDRAWPRPIRSTALLTALAQLPATPDRTLLIPGQPPKTPTAITDRLTITLHAAAIQAATDLRGNRARNLTHALTAASRHATRTLPAGYDLLLEREMTLRLALTLALPTTGALAPGLDLALAHATSTTNRTELADLILTALRPAPTRPAPTPVFRSHLAHVPRQRVIAGPCTCACASGGFCGGCGHAGCARR